VLFAQWSKGSMPIFSSSNSQGKSIPVFPALLAAWTENQIV